jgi:hypothetical protein
MSRLKPQQRQLNLLERQQRQFKEWFGSRTPEEYELAVEAACLEDYFADLQLKSKAIVKRLLTYKMKSEDGRWITVDDDALEEGTEGLDSWIFRFRRFRELLGLCDPKRKTIFIKPGLPKDEHRATLLHEMIHAYESKLPRQFAEWLILDLYQRVSRRLPERRLNSYIDLSTHIFIHHVQHGLLFLLKSLDLDLRLGWKPGKVFGYGREDCFADVK